jgi:hypothetical protein
MVKKAALQRPRGSPISAEEPDFKPAARPLYIWARAESGQFDAFSGGRPVVLKPIDKIFFTHRCESWRGTMACADLIKPPDCEKLRDRPTFRLKVFPLTTWGSTLVFDKFPGNFR